MRAVQTPGLDCVYVTEENETRQHAVKRKYDELSQFYQSLRIVHEALAGSDESRAIDVFRRIRAGHQPENVVKNIQRSDPHESLVSSYEWQLRQNFLVALSQSTAPLWEVVQTTASVFNSQTRLPCPQAKPFKL